MKDYNGKLPSINIRFTDETYKQWKRYELTEIFKEVRQLTEVLKKAKTEIKGSVKVVYKPDYVNEFDFDGTNDLINKLKPSLELEQLRHMYETDS